MIVYVVYRDDGKYVSPPMAVCSTEDKTHGWIDTQSKPWELDYFPLEVDDGA
jgi:hypothetical protein